MTNDPRLLYEDNHLIVVHKPSGLATMGVGPDEPSAVRWAARYLKEKYRKPGNVYVGVVSRLDSLVSGILVLAKTSKAASRLSEQIRQRSTLKRYMAIVENTIDRPSNFTKLEHYLAKNEKQQRMQVVAESTSGAHHATMYLRKLAVLDQRSIVEVELITGRKHQIRVQLAAIGYPIVGDGKYGAEQRWPVGIGLHCYRYELEHPTKRERMSFVAWPEPWKRMLGERIYDETCAKLATDQE